MPVRKIPKSYCSVTGLVANDKSGRMTAYESSLERDCYKLAIFNNNVLNLEEQPVKITFTGDDGKQHSYTPDVLITYRQDLSPAAQWNPLLAEIKYRKQLFKKWPELKPKFKAARRYTKEKGWDFTVITDWEIRTPYLQNVIFLLEYRNLPANEYYANLLLTTLKDLRKASPETLLLNISEDHNSRAQLLPTLWQLVANHMIGINLEKPLTMRCPIWSTHSQEDEHDSLYQIRAGHN